MAPVLTLFFAGYGAPHWNSRPVFDLAYWRTERSAIFRRRIELLDQLSELGVPWRADVSKSDNQVYNAKKRKYARRRYIEISIVIEGEDATSLARLVVSDCDWFGR